VGVEDKTNAIRSLNYVKEQLKINPKLVTCDLSPKLIGAIIDVFGEDVLQIDGFHVMQLLNNGVRSDLKYFRNKVFRNEINELFNLSRWFSKIQKIKDKSVILSILQSPPKINLKHQSNSNFLKVALDFLTLIIENDENFKEKTIKLLETTLKNNINNELYQQFYANLNKNIPKKELTCKGRKKLVVEIIKKLKKLTINLRQPLELKKKKFSTKIWALFYQPENQTEKRKETLENLVKEYPELIIYRQIMLQVGSIYRKEIDDITRKEIENLEVKPEYSKELKTAINTLKKYQASIYRFIDVFKMNSDMGKECRANTEFLNRNFKAPFKQGLNCVKETHLKAKIGLQMGCKVRCFLAEKI
jgi:hypothetical protein